MSYRRYKLQLISRNEGKIKSYESCTDLRAWSHDLQTRDYYLRDWMRSDMPICVIPVCTVTKVLTNMTRRNYTKLTPSCHPECKSKILLESVCASCHAIRQCLNNDETFEKYFQEEELETGHWPCDKCLIALKSIKMFWQIILDKIFGINMATKKEYNSSMCSSVRSIAKSYLQEINEQTIYLRKIMSAKGKYDGYENKSETIRFKIYSNDFVILTPKESTHKIILDEKCVGGDSELVKDVKVEKVSQGITVRCKTVDFGCECDIKSEDINTHKNIDYPKKDNSQNTELDKLMKADCVCETCELKNNEIQAYKNNIDFLQNRLNSHSIQLATATKENIALKLELQQIYRNNTWSSYHNQPNFVPFQSLDVPPPFESIMEENNDLSKTTDSEMIITLKNCKNETYKNISLLQVIHKSNTEKEKDCSCHQDDPIKILTKVQNTFGNIVEREMSIVKEKYGNMNDATMINSSYVNVESVRAQSASSTLSLQSISSDTVFVSTTD